MHTIRATAGRAAARGSIALLVLWAITATSMLATRVSAAELVMFDSQSCSRCRRWDAEVGVGYHKTDEGQRAPLRRVDIAQAARSGVRLARPVNSTPTFVLVEDGAEVARITGYPGADFFWGQLGEMLDQLGPPQPRQPLPERERSARVD